MAINEFIQGDSNNSETGTGVSDDTIVLGVPGTVADETVEVTTLTTPAPQQKLEEKRVEADLSDLPEREQIGVETRISKVDDILGEDGAGGIFAKVLDEKAKEVQELNDAIDAHNEAVAAALGEDVPEEITDKEVTESAAKLRDMNIPNDEDFEDTLSSTDDEYVDDMEKEFEDDIRGSVVSITKANKSSEKKNDLEKHETIIEPKKLKNVSFDIDQEDEVLDDPETDSDEEDNLEEIRNSITDKIAPVSKRLNISGFTIAKKPVSVSAALEGIEKKAADWVLASSNTHFGMMEFSGTEVQSLGDANGLNQYEAMTKRYKILYNHLVGENKPSSVESMVKSISYFDDDHLFMGAYIANFAGANYIPYDCPNPKCKHTFLSEDIPIDSMYKFEKEEDKKKFMEALNGQMKELSELYTTEAIPISNKFAIGFREPSIYNYVFEPSIIDDKFATKYRDIISVLSYIDEIYVIDFDNEQLAPLSYKRYPNNKLKDIKSRIIAYSHVFNSLTPDEYNIIIAYIQAINDKTTTISYILPETVCPKCGRVIPETATTAQQLLFMRHQLAALATTSIK